MNISFQTTDITDKKSSDIGKSNYYASIQKADTTQTRKSSGVYADIGNQSSFDVTAYSKGSTESSNSADTKASKEVEALRKMDIVYSNTMSGADYEKAKQDGYSLKDVNSEDAVNIVDRIKTELAEAGTVITGFNDDLSVDDLADITGSTAYANEIVNSFHENDIPISNDNVIDTINAVNTALGLVTPSEEALLYLAGNEAEPTIRNIYEASYSTNGNDNVSRGTYFEQDIEGYVAQSGNADGFTELSKDIEKVVESAGFDKKDKTAINAATEIVENGVPLTDNTLSAYIVNKEMVFPVERQTAISAAALAISSGKEAMDGNLSIVNDKNENQTNLTAARRQLEESRLMMTTKANSELLDSGLQIDIQPMEELISKLKETEDVGSDDISSVIVQDGSLLTNNASNADTAVEIYQKLAAFSAMHVGLIGAYSDEFKTDTLGEIIDHTSETEFSYVVNEKIRNTSAEDTYEALMTKPRSDLGDSISKAFGNTDEILQDLDMDITQDNQRAVRILGYNSMELTKENIEDVRAIDSKLTKVVDSLKPGTVLNMIRENKNPLNMTLDELDTYLDEKNSSTSAADEKFEKFLFKLDRSGDISSEERSSYIGIYRLFDNLQRTDDAAIGMVLGTRAEMTVGNLLTAMKSINTASGKGIDYKIDDSFGGVDDVSSGIKISDQIESAFTYYSEKADETFDKLEPEKLIEFEPSGETTLLELSDAMEELDVSSELENEWNKVQRREIADSFSGSEGGTDGLSAAEKLLLNSGETVTVSLLEGTKELLESRKKNGDSALGKVKKKMSTADIDSIRKGFLDDDTDDTTQSYKASLEDISTSIEDELRDFISDTDVTYIDMKVISLVNKQLSVAERMADHNSFEIPIISGDEIVSMHVTLSDKLEGGAKVEAAIDTNECGSLRAVMDIDEGNVSGVFLVEAEETQAIKAYCEGVIQKLEEGIKNNYSNLKFDQKDMAVIYGSKRETVTEVGSDTKVSDKALFNLAKAFVKSV